MSIKEPDYALVFRSLPAPCLVLDQEMRIVTATEAYLQTVDRSLSDLVGRYVFDAFPEEGERQDRFHRAFRRALDGEENTLVEVPFSIPANGPDGPVMREVWWTCRHTPVIEADGRIDYMIQNAMDVTAQVQAQRLKNAIADELQHRVGNLFSLVSVIARRTAANATDLADFASRFEARVQALSRTHAHLTGSNWDRMTIDTIVTRQLDDYAAMARGNITLEGERVELSAAEAQALTLAIHELATNSVKYGALQTEDGRIVVNWANSGRSGYDIEWREIGIPDGERKARSGFGSMILDTIVPTQLQGSAERNFDGPTLRYRLSVPERRPVRGADGAR
ncbi:HWE histidine kinase domain-containing protein [Oceaniglobus roseus]|uniref:HWE histidine kinase domain-containing protein n=1 Tax=Oceaniglobus roseus TaxID=1737570 RepID=UPI000C7F1209|nr:HWE histidine kinase domain-containing protein [Kandeliimicrobium roseum]